MVTPTSYRRSNHRGITMVYALLIMAVLFAFTSLAVDWGRVQMAKTQLHSSAAAASRYGATMLAVSPAAASSGAIAAAGENAVDNTKLVLDANNDVEIGYWNTNTRTFTKLTGAAQSNANAVRVVARRVASRGTAIPTIFAHFLGRESCDISVESITMRVPPTVIEKEVPATASPYLAGSPRGTVTSLNNAHNNPDRMSTAAPAQINLTLRDGEALTFDNIAGGANNDNNWDPIHQPDGNLGWIVDNGTGRGEGKIDMPEQGKSDLIAPINALVGVFLTDEVPTNGNAPSWLDFSTAASRNFDTLSPKIAQVFFIGNGKKDDGTPQKFIVPQGATRFYLGNWDEYEWNNNIGTRTTRITRLGSVVTVK